MKTIRLTLSLCLYLLATQAVFASDIQSSVNRLCEKVEQCMMPEIEASDIPASMLDQMVTQMRNQCRSMYDWSDKVLEGDLKDAAIACLDSMSDVSCDELMGENEIQTAECKAYEGLTQ